ncbi:MAG: DNA cytosine methyltransferase [Candidatus Saccharibacteria bacterium]
MNEYKPGYVSLFSSAGVGCYGFSLEGFDCIATSELIQRRLDVQKANKVCSLEDGYVVGDFTLDVTKEKVIRAINIWKKTYKKNEVDVLIATPPCQGISVANHKKNNELKRNSLVVESLILTRRIMPRYFILENVRGFLKTVCTDIDGNDKPIMEAINTNLAGHYNIAHRIINFKDYGNNSSRTRTLVIGVRKDIEDVTPYQLFPTEQQAPTLRELIGDLKPLKEMGEIDKNDIYHNFKNYDKRMLEWIKDVKEGQSAFDNTDPHKRPHKIVNGAITQNANKNSDKYSRCYWDKTAPCVHTRNDILASQATIHPRDNRVFSIRELMRFMSVPRTFVWSCDDINRLNAAPYKDKLDYLKKHEINIRQSLGEAVPTAIFQSISGNIKKLDSQKSLSLNQVKRTIEKESLAVIDNLLDYIEKKRPSFTDATKIAELANAKRLDDAAFYTRQELCFNLVVDLPDFKNKKIVRILEPSVGVGNFLPVIFEKYKHIETVKLDLVDINDDSIRTLKKIIKLIEVPSNFELKIIHDNFLTKEFRIKYDVVIGNPPFGVITAKEYQNYQLSGLGSTAGTKNLFALFIEKALQISDYVALFSPKSLLSAPEFDKLRLKLSTKEILKICDYGEKGFKGVKIETISTQISNKPENHKTIIDSYILKSYLVQNQDYIIDSEFPTWLIYRNSFFDEIASKLDLGIFKAFRDRTLTSKNMLPKGKIRVVKSRNITSDGIIPLLNDQYVDSHDASAISGQYFGSTSIVVAPNLSYYPRAALLPPGSIVDGSAAVLMPIKDTHIDPLSLKFFASKEYFLFYRIARNYATRSLNIDRNSVFYWGLPKDINHKYMHFEAEANKSLFLFAKDCDLFNTGVAV